jgi:hypothetical protein
MEFVLHLWKLLLLLTIVAGPVPYCLLFTLLNHQETKRRLFSHFVLASITTWSVVQICLGLFLGSLKQLNLSLLIFCEIILFVTGLIALWNYQTSHQPLTVKNCFKLNQRLTQSELMILAAISFVGVILLERLAIQPITDHDSLLFQLPIITRWYQTGSLTFSDPAGQWIFDNAQYQLYPYNWQLLCALFLIPFQEDFLVSCPLLLAWILLGLAVYRLSIILGAERIYAMAGSCLVLTLPMIVNQVNTIHVDLPLAAFFMVGIYSLMMYNKSRAFTDLYLLLISLGILSGIKITGLAYTGFILISLVILEVRKLIFCKPIFLICSKKFNPITKKNILIIGIILFIFTGSFWYLKNLVGIYHYIPDIASIKIASNELVPIKAGLDFSEFHKSTLAHQFNPNNLRNWKILIIQVVARLQFPFLVMLFQVFLLPFIFLKPSKRISQKKLWYLFFLIFGAAVLYFYTPYSSGTSGEFPGYIGSLFGYNLRYGFPFISILGVAAAVSATLFKTRSVYLVIAVLVSSILSIVNSTIFDILRSTAIDPSENFSAANDLLNPLRYSLTETQRIVLGTLEDQFKHIGIYVVLYFLILLLFLLILNHQYFKRFNFVHFMMENKHKFVFLSLCLILITSASWVAHEKRDEARFQTYQGIYEYMEHHLDKDENIGYLLSPRNYLLYGKELDRQVFHVPMNSEHTTQWLQNIQAANIQIIATGPIRRDDPTALKIIDWFQNEKTPLIKIFGNNIQKELVLYRLQDKKV